MSIRDDIDKLGASGSDTAKGQCAKCGNENPYSSIACSGCGARLPWADAVSDKARANASTHAPLSIASARATVNQPPGASGPGSGPGSGGSRGLLTPTIATVLLIVDGLIGAAVVVPNFVSRSQTVQPTPMAALQAPNSAPVAPSSVPTYQAPAQGPQQAPVVPAPQAPQLAPPGDTRATADEERFFKALSRSGEPLAGIDPDSMKSPVVRAETKAAIDQASLELNSAIPSERLVTAGILTVVELERQALTEMRLAISELDGAFGAQGEIENRDALDRAIQGVRTSSALSHRAADKMREIRARVVR